MVLNKSHFNSGKNLEAVIVLMTMANLETILKNKGLIILVFETRDLMRIFSLELEKRALKYGELKALDSRLAATGLLRSGHFSPLISGGALLLLESDLKKSNEKLLLAKQIPMSENVWLVTTGRVEFFWCFSLKGSLGPLIMGKK